MSLVSHVRAVLRLIPLHTWHVLIMAVDCRLIPRGRHSPLSPSFQHPDPHAVHVVQPRLLLHSDAREDSVTPRPNSLDEGAVGATRTPEDIELHRPHAVVGPVVGFQSRGQLKGCLGAVEDGLIGRADVVGKLDGGRETWMRFGGLVVDSQERKGGAFRVALAYERQVQVEVVWI